MSRPLPALPAQTRKAKALHTQARASTNPDEDEAARQAAYAAYRNGEITKRQRNCVLESVSTRRHMRDLPRLAPVCVACGGRPQVDTNDKGLCDFCEPVEG